MTSPSRTSYSRPSSRMRARRARARLAARGDVVVEGDHLGADERSLEVAVDHAGRLRRERAAPDRPGAHLLGTRREEGDQAEQLVGGADQQIQTGRVEAEVREEGPAVVRRQLGELRLDLRAQPDRGPPPSAWRTPPARGSARCP